MVRVVAGNVTLTYYSAKKVRMTFNIFADAEKRRYYIISGKGFQNKFCRSRNRPIVERKVEVLALSG
jgi:hypothetical protein